MNLSIVGLTFIIVSILHTSLVSCQYDPSSHKGTTFNIEQVFQGRCWDYEETRYLTLLPRVEADCKDLWSLFFKAFSYQPPCYVNTAGYLPFFKAARQTVPENKTMFWSGVFNLAHRLGQDGHRYVTLEDTLIGYLASSITWCGQSIDPGMNFTRCPAWDDCPTEATESFWSGASFTFAGEASGEVTIMLDGSNPDKKAYRKDSFFGKYELPNLGKNVTSLKVIVSHELDKPKLEKCGHGTLVDLENDVKRKGIPYACIDDPLAVMHLLCADDPSNRECQLVAAHQTGGLGQRSTTRRLLNDMPDFFV